MTFPRADVALVRYPDSNLRSFKRRPALVVQATELETGLPQVIVAMITSKGFRANHPSRVAISIGAEPHESGLVTDSVVMTDNLATIRTGEVERVLGTIRDFDPIERALRHTFGLR